MTTDQELFDLSDFGSFYTPPAVVQFLADLVAPKPEESALAIGFDPNILVGLAGEHVRWRGVKNRPAPELLNAIGGRHDAIICAPIFGLTLEAGLGGHGESHEEFWLRWCVSHLSDAGRLAIIVPAGMLSNFSQRSTRSFLLKEASIQAILELPAGWAQGTATQASILLLAPHRRRKATVNLFRFEEAEAIPWSELVPYVLAPDPTLPHGFFGKGYTVPAIALSDFRLDPHYYDPAYTNVVTPEPPEFATVKLSEIVEIRSGERFPK